MTPSYLTTSTCDINQRAISPPVRERTVAITPNQASSAKMLAAGLGSPSRLTRTLLKGTATRLGSCTYVIMLARLGSTFVTTSVAGRNPLSHRAWQRRSFDRVHVLGAPTLQRAFAENAAVMEGDSTAEARRVEVAKRRAERRSRRSESIQKSVEKRSVGR